jgi:hypothetical protein
VHLELRHLLVHAAQLCTNDHGYWVLEERADVVYWNDGGW